MHRLDKVSADCFVLTDKEGLLAAVAYDLKIRVNAFQIGVDEVTFGAPGAILRSE